MDRAEVIALILSGHECTNPCRNNVKICGEYCKDKDDYNICKRGGVIFGYTCCSILDTNGHIGCKHYVGLEDKKLKNGRLKKNTVLHTINGISFKVPSGTVVLSNKRVVKFGEDHPYTITKDRGDYYVNAWKTKFKIVLPNGGRPPYPLTLLK